MSSATAAIWATRGPKFSRATTYEPPARVYTDTTSRYDSTTSSTPNRTTSVSGSTSVKAASPKNGSSAYKISSVPYAAEESPSQDSTPSASGRDSRWFVSCSVTSGGPSTRHLT